MRVSLISATLCLMATLRAAPAVVAMRARSRYVDPLPVCTGAAMAAASICVRRVLRSSPSASPLGVAVTMRLAKTVYQWEDRSVTLSICTA